ncbi:hypothetical protein ACGF5C_27320 [Micromonospora sp. NPDC047620]|uniref:hypothetical protein n=1 Tax=Micromonospora sp. NPDC047620 TaxID=3364251 RepID=UPI00371980E8
MSIYAVLIDGWDQRSTWGWDDGTRSYYAQLTRNGNSDDNGPEVWITPPAWPNLSAPEHLAMAIAAATRTDRAVVQNAMNDSLDDGDGQRHRIRSTNPAPRPQAKPSASHPSTGRAMTTPQEQPWWPVDDDPNTIFLINPQGNRHLSFDNRTGTWWRLWQHQPAERLSADAAALLRPSDIDVIIKLSNTWILQHPDHQRAHQLTDELARGAKALVLHFAGLAGAR